MGNFYSVNNSSSNILGQDLNTVILKQLLCNFDPFLCHNVTVSDVHIRSFK